MNNNAFVGQNAGRNYVDPFGFRATAETGQPSATLPNEENIDIGTEDIKNLKPAENSSMSLVMLLFLYLLWGLIQKQSFKDQLKAGTIKANFANLVLTSLTAIVGINFLNVLFTKLVKWDIPVISKVAGAFLPLVRL